MKKKKPYFVLILLIIIGVIEGSVFLLTNNANDNNEIPDGYIAIFRGGSGEITYETYIYKKNNNQTNYEFDYINVTSTTKSWGSDEWNKKVTKKVPFNGRKMYLRLLKIIMLIHM